LPFPGVCLGLSVLATRQICLDALCEQISEQGKDGTHSTDVAPNEGQPSPA